MTQKNLLEIITFDYKLIDEAIRRLIDGTCCLTDENELLSVNELFEKLRIAVRDHIDFEEKSAFKLLLAKKNDARVSDFISKMQVEHSELIELLNAIKLEVDHAHAIAFRALLREFLEKLSKHRALEASVPYGELINEVADESLRHILSRSREMFLK